MKRGEVVKWFLLLLGMLVLDTVGSPLYAQVAGQVALKGGTVFQGAIIEMSRGVLQTRSLTGRGKSTSLA